MDDDIVRGSGLQAAAPPKLGSLLLRTVTRFGAVIGRSAQSTPVPSHHGAATAVAAIAVAGRHVQLAHMLPTPLPLAAMKPESEAASDCMPSSDGERVTAVACALDALRTISPLVSIPSPVRAHSAPPAPWAPTGSA